ncbi:M17 family metallopeptidase [Avibacterium paragallinarum]|nr:leucyl aminopeptidase family protein [Avibacterium paragallinarum]
MDEKLSIKLSGGFKMTINCLLKIIDDQLSLPPNSVFISWKSSVSNLNHLYPNLFISPTYTSIPLSIHHYFFENDKTFYQERYYFLKNSLKDLKRYINNIHHIILDLTEFDPKNNDDIALAENILLTLYNSVYDISDLGFKHKNETQKHEFLLLIKNQVELWKRLNDEFIIIGKAMVKARKLADLPANIATPLYYSQYLENYAKKNRLDIQILDNHSLCQYGFDALYTVGKASQYSSYLIKISYNGIPDNNHRYLFVGKGITFDTGGLWLKSGEKMATMKYDVCGAAVLIGLLDSVVKMQLPINITIILGFAENTVGNNAMRPGDIIKSYSGKFIEIINTDAEGRLILADLLSYATEQKPTYIIDVATLTGAIVKTLGYEINGVMSNNEELVHKMKQASEQSKQRIWQLPCDDSFKPQIESKIADLTNTPPNNAAISISAAYFLSSFVKQYPWLHLDISGTALDHNQNICANGNPLPLLYHFLKNESC